MVYLYLEGAFRIVHMVKCKTKIKRKDIVRYGGHEWYVMRKKHDKCQLARREVVTGVPIWVPTNKVKLASSSWRYDLQAGDSVKVFVGSLWCSAKVLRREGNTLCFQLSFTNFTLRLPQSSGRIAEASHDFPLWSEQTARFIIHNSCLRVERAPGVLFPMEYAKGTPVRKPNGMFITTLKFPFQKMPSFSMKLYDQLSNTEIMHDISTSQTHDMPILLRYIAAQYVNFRSYFYQLPNNLLQSYADIALVNNDHARVEELMTASDNEGVLFRSEWAIRKYFSVPYFDVNVRTTTCLEIDLFWNKTFQAKIPPPVKEILLHISKPMQYAPTLYEIDSTPCLQFVLSRMLGMEEEPLQALHLREANGFFLTEDNGFCSKNYDKFGGVINVYGLDIVALVRNLIKRSPLKTMVIVEPSVLPLWSSFAWWYGRRKEDDLVVVTTKGTLSKAWTQLKGFKRIVSTVMPTPNTIYSDILKKHSAKIRWAICQDSNEHLGWHMVGEKPDARARIYCTKAHLESMGVLFPMMSVQKIVCWCSHESYTQILKNTYFLPPKKVNEYLSKFLLHPQLVPVHVRGIRLDVCEGTIDVIAQRFKLKEDLLLSRTKETCSVCLDTIQNPSVTSCGHVFCDTCVKELDDRKINCAMCRTKFSGYMKISDTNTPGIIEMHNGSCYRIPEEETWGLKYDILKKFQTATFITKFSTVKSKLKKVFPKTAILTEKALKSGMIVLTEKVVAVEPGIDLKYLDKAWSQNLEIVQLCYAVKH